MLDLKFGTQCPPLRAFLWPLVPALHATHSKLYGFMHGLLSLSVATPRFCAAHNRLALAHSMDNHAISNICCTIVTQLSQDQKRYGLTSVAFTHTVELWHPGRHHTRDRTAPLAVPERVNGW